MKRDFKGLSADAVELSRKKYGDNSLSKEKTKSFFKRFLQNLSDPIIRVLIIAVILEVVFTLGNCNWLETAGIVIAVLIATVVSTVSEHGSERAFLKMQEANKSAKAKALRQGAVVELPIEEIVVGDIIYLCSGDIIPADGILVEGKLTVDQSALNGESAEVEKIPEGRGEKGSLSSPTNVFRGSMVVDGEGTFKVEAVGNNTYYGMVAKDVQAETRESPLKLRLGVLASQISKLGYIMAAVVGLTYLFFAYVVDNGFDPAAILETLRNIPFVIATLSHALTLMITVVVVAVPEGLPMMITVVLSANMKRMLKDKVMVKKLVGIETAGSMNVLFTDKTGTLTEGKPTVEAVVTPYLTYPSLEKLKGNKALFEILYASSLDTAGQGAGIRGNSTDKALQAFFAGVSIPAVSIISKTPFSSDKKYSAVTTKSGIKIIKGAPEKLLPACLYQLTAAGDRQPFDRALTEEEFKSRARGGQRIIAVAYEAPGEDSLTFAALISLKDKIRAGTKEAVARVRAAGVRVVMITGDSKETASAIATECGILAHGAASGVLTHSELDSMTDAELKAHLPTLRVVARALPQDKTRLVRLCQEENLVVGMTGDGVNDAPSLKLADVGFAMGDGTEIAKSAGDIVILDNSFMAISKTILYGRTIFKSIRKFISFQLMMNLAACGASLLGQFVGIDNPITIIQMLWVNIIMDTLGGLAFSGEPPLEYYMMEKPKSRDEKILSRSMLGQVLFTGGYTLLLCMAFLSFDFFKGIFVADGADARFLTGFYALFVFAGIFNCFNARSERMWLFSNIGKNKIFLLIMSFIAAVQIFIIYFSGEIFRCTPLALGELISVILLASTVIPFDMLRRILKKLK